MFSRFSACSAYSSALLSNRTEIFKSYIQLDFPKSFNYFQVSKLVLKLV